MIEEYSSDVLWIVILGFIVSFILAFGIGANDVANSFATSVGSGVLTIKQACYLASVFEIAGSILLGFKVSDTIRKGIFNIDLYKGHEKELMLGMLAALIGCATWLLVATYFKLPVSTTHSIIGASVGFALVARGAEGIKWREIGIIAASWVISPIMAGAISVAVYLLVYKFILKSPTPFKSGIKALPIIWGVVLFVNVLSITLDGSRLLGMHYLEVWMSFVISTAVALITMVIIHFSVAPWQEKKILAQHPYQPTSTSIHSVTSIEKGNGFSTNSSDSVSPIVKAGEKEEESRVNLLFHFVQILAAIFSSFAHGGNDVANAIGPLITIWLVYTTGDVANKAETPIPLLAYGGFGIVFGLWFFGRRVIETVGFDLTTITPATGVTIESGSAATVLMASKIGVPISTTHCKVGAVTFVGWVYGKTFKKNFEVQEVEKVDNVETENKGHVNWKLFAGIVSAWVITLPATGLCSAFVFFLLKFTI